MEMIKIISKLAAYPLFLAVRLYQKTLSPDHGLLSFLFPYGYCQFYPSCSMFAKEVLKAEGLLGLPKIIKRIYSCNPQSKGGFDYPYSKL